MLEFAPVARVRADGCPSPLPSPRNFRHFGGRRDAGSGFLAWDEKNPSLGGAPPPNGGNFGRQGQHGRRPITGGNFGRQGRRGPQSQRGRERSSAAQSPEARRSISTSPSRRNARPTSSASPTSSPLAMTR